MYDLFFNRGNALGAAKRFDEALESYDRAIACKPDYVEALNNRGLILAELKRYDEAIADYDRAIALSQDDADLFFNKGNALRELKRFDEALASYDKAIALKPAYAEAYNSRGIVLAELEQFDAALASYEQAIARKSDYVEAFNNRGIALRQLKQFDAALASYDRAIAIKPDYEVSFTNRGNLLKEMKRLDEALASYDQAIARKPDYAEAFNNRGNVLRELRRLDEALASYDQAIALKADFAEAFNNRGLVLNDLQRLDEAVASCDKAIMLKSDFVEAFHNRGSALNNLKRFDEVVVCCDRAMALKPDQKYLGGLRLHAKMHICDWNHFKDDCSHLASKLENKILVSQPFALLSLPLEPEIQLKCAELYIADRHPPASMPFWRGERYAHQKIRVAYVSADLRDHAVAVLTAGLFEHHDKSRFETIAVSLSTDQKDRMSERLKASFDRFIDASTKSDREVAALLRDLEIDIAVDLNGFTGGARSDIFASRAAPVQVNYLGYAGTLGKNYWDYIVADRFVISEDRQADYAEKVVYLPDSFMANDSSRKIAERVFSRTEAGLPEQGFVFCCFNNSYKFTPDVFDVWMRLLRAVAGSVLWLPENNASAMTNLRAEAEKRNVSPERLIIAPRVPSNEEHLARLRLADLFLDTLYYNAHTTACDALWAGLPIMTCPGQTFASRVAGSLLSAVGLPELITSSLADYEALALKLARDPAQLAAIKDKLARQRTTYPLFSTERFTRHLEAAYTTMWQRSQRGEPPQSFAVNTKFD